MTYSHAPLCRCDACRQERREQRARDARVAFLRGLRKEGRLSLRTPDGGFLV